MVRPNRAALREWLEEPESSRDDGIVSSRDLAAAVDRELDRERGLEPASDAELEQMFEGACESTMDVTSSDLLLEDYESTDAGTADEDTPLPLTRRSGLPPLPPRLPDAPPSRAESDAGWMSSFSPPHSEPTEPAESE